MKSIQSMSAAIQQELARQFEENLRAQLKKKSKAWLTEELIRLMIPPVPAVPTDTEDQQVRQSRFERLRSLQLCPSELHFFLSTYDNCDRDKLTADGYLQPESPRQGLGMLGDHHRTANGAELLLLTRDILFGLLFGEEQHGVQFQRTHREILCVTLPRHKAHALNFMQAATQHTVAGTWLDPESVSNDVRTENIVQEIEFGETAEELVGDGIMRCLHLINLLEINEQILYARMSNVEQSSLIPSF